MPIFLPSEEFYKDKVGIFFEDKTFNRRQLILLLSVLLSLPGLISKCALCQVHINTVLLTVLLEILTL